MKIFTLKGGEQCPYNGQKQNAISVVITKGLKYINVISQYTCLLTTGQMVPQSHVISRMEKKLDSKCQVDAHNIISSKTNTFPLSASILTPNVLRNKRGKFQSFLITVKVSLAGKIVSALQFPKL